MPQARVVEVAVPLPLDQTFDYALEDDCPLEPGARVLVPYGRRRLVGMAVGVRSRRDDEPALRAVLRVVDAEPVLPRALLDVVVQAARDALCPLGLALAAAAPAGTAPRPAAYWTLRPAGQRALERGELRAGAADCLRALARSPLSEAELRARFPAAAAALAQLERLGWVGRGSGTRAPRVQIKTQRRYRLAEGVDLAAARARLSRAPRQLALLEQLAQAPRLLAASAALRALVEAGWATWDDQPVSRTSQPAPLVPAAGAPQLTAAQQAAVDAVTSAIEAREGRAFLLYGVTGSGKTEVYLRAAEAALTRDRAVVVLVPEISLTHQVVDRFRARFGDRVAVLHSGLSAGERFDQWRRIRAGEVPIAIGARSAVFAPFEELGLIAIDEEHDSAYKSAEGFRYHARDLAELRARAARCPLLLGSATPDVETAHRAARGEIGLLRLPERVARRPLPSVEIVDMERERQRTGRRRMLSGPLRRALAETLAAGQQAILFLNRRGFATLVYCFACGHALHCRHCDIALVYHASGGERRRDDPLEGELRCHYCGYVEPPRLACPGCGSRDGGLLGFGTERLAEEVASMFPRARVARLDRDTSARKGAQRAILSAFHRRELDVLVGTQMIAKGHDVPGVTLVGVVAADLGLHMPDFRAGERTFQLLTQVAGRAGRGDLPGRVVIQTFLPQHYAIALARAQDFGRFYREELARRAPHGYPPFRTLIQIALWGRRAEAVEAAALELARLAKEVAPESEGLEWLGPAPAPLSRIRDEFRWQLLLLGEREAALRAARALRQRARFAGVSLRLDASPLQML
jgi:primosomal protein N' (replication factor Y)